MEFGSWNLNLLSKARSQSIVQSAPTRIAHATAERHGYHCATVADLKVCRPLILFLRLEMTDLLDRFIDPLFGIATGLSAAYLKIQREQRQKYGDEASTFPALRQKLLAMNRVYWGYERNAEK